MNSSTVDTRNAYRIGRLLGLVCCLISFFAANSVLATGFKPQQWEILASSDMCKKVYSRRPEGKGLPLGPPNETEGSLISGIGAWHFCAGAVLVRRAEGLQNGRQREALFKMALAEIDYTYSRIDKANYWAAEMGTEIARAYKGLRNYDKAAEYLDTALRYHPDYKPAFVMYGLVYYAQEKYARARDYFLKAQGDGEDAQLSYFLGLAAFKLGDYDQARRYAREAKSRGYPLKGLENMLAGVYSSES